MQPEILSALIGASVVLVGFVIGAIWWGSKITTRVTRLEADVEGLKESQQEILKLLNRHIGRHGGLDKF